MATYHILSRHGGRVHILSVGLAVFQILVSSSSQHCYGCTFPSKWREFHQSERKRGRGKERKRGRGTRKVGRERKAQSGAEWAEGRLRGWTAVRGRGGSGKTGEVGEWGEAGEGEEEGWEGQEWGWVEAGGSMLRAGEGKVCRWILLPCSTT